MTNISEVNSVNFQITPDMKDHTAVTSHRRDRVNHTNRHITNDLSNYNSTQYLGNFGSEENTKISKQAQHLAGMFSSD